MNQLLSDNQHSIVSQEFIPHASQSLLVKEKARHSQSVQTQSVLWSSVCLSVCLLYLSDENHHGTETEEGLCVLLASTGATYS